MPITLYESSDSKQTATDPVSVVTGVVVNNIDLLGQGKIKVRIPDLDEEVWARLSAPGGGPDEGYLHVPKIDSEVLLAYVHSRPPCAYMLNGLWNTQDSPPVENRLNPAELLVKRVIQSAGGRIEIDDLLQSITIETSTGQQLSMDLFTIKLATSDETMSVTMDMATQTLSIESTGVIELNAPVVKINGDLRVEIGGGTIAIGATTDCSVKGTPVRIN